MSSKAQFFKNVMKSKTESRNKVTVVGSGSVGTAVAFSILTQNISNDVVIVDRNEDEVRGELLDLQHGSYFLKNARVCGGDDVSPTAGSKLIIFTAESKRVKDENRIELVQKNIEIFKYFLPTLVDKSPDCILLVVTNPCDILSYVAWKISGLPPHRVIGSGTHLDSTRFQSLLAEKLDAQVATVCGWIIGEQGEYSVAAWNSVRIGDTRLREVNPQAGLENDRENWSEVHKQLIKSGMEVKKLKGYASWSIGLSCADIASSIFRGSDDIKTVSTRVKGLHGINKEVFLSLPCTLNSNGISSVVNICLSDDEKKQLRVSADFIDEVLKTAIF